MRIWTTICLLAAACEAPAATTEDGPDDSFLVGGKADTGGIADGTPDALGVLALVNGADFTTLNKKVKVESRAAHNIFNHRVGADGVAGTADDNPFDTLAELDAIPYVGPATFAKLLSYAQAHGYVMSAPDLAPAPPLPWEAGLPATFQSTVTVTMPGSQTYCQPNCLDRNAGISLNVTVARDASGTITLAYNWVDDYPPEPLNSDGTFHREDYFDNPNGNGVIEVNGHLEANRTLVIDLFAYDFSYSAGMFNGWTTSDTSTGPGSAAF